MARPTRRLGNVPSEATTFVGRRRELAEVKSRLAAARVVSLVGPGGVGKTRLAIRAAAEVARGFPGGEWFVGLADVRDSSLVSIAVAAGLDLRDQAAIEPLQLLLDYLKDRQLLIVIDNCEHLLRPAAELISQVVSAAPGVRVLATSREPLSVQGEYVIPVPPLDLPPAHAGEPLSRLRQYEAVMLFSERATAASGRFEVTSENGVAVADLCRRLDGLPLAIELAAVRTRVLSVEQILDRLSDRFGLLTSGGQAALPRHRTLRVTIDWSHDLLEQPEQTLLRRLCVFAGRFTLEDVEGTCTFDDVPVSRVLDVLSSLVDKSLVLKDDFRGVASYRLHETMREYGRLKLIEAGEVEMVGERFIAYYRSACERASERARYRLIEWLEWIDFEIDNVRPVIRHCLNQGDAVRGIALVLSLGFFWMTRATTEGVRWLDELLAIGRGEPSLLAWAYHVRGFLALLQSDPLAARPDFERAVAAARTTAQPALLSQAFSLASVGENLAGDRVAADRLLEEARIVTGKVDDYPATITFIQARALNAVFRGDLDTAREASEEGTRLGREKGDLYALEMMLLNRGTTALIAGDVDAARPPLAESLKIGQQIDDRIAQYYLLDAFGFIAAHSGQPRVAAQLLGAAETIRTGAGASVIPTIAQLIAQAEELATKAIGASRFATELQAGRLMGRSAAIATALGESRHAPAAAVFDDAHTMQLARRELEVARLVAEGLSNKQIGARLFISERTVDGHIRNILNKLGVNSRAQIAAWMASFAQPRAQ
ncbi:MAG TPA: LuxR C-terminal-related transcriptional regulator [Candidatus Dormibacteraeota bacterium]|nr:LuxR C-terminal-related transcriptional regulator [Candidatus Dormibacteraeota bacterium]